MTSRSRLRAAASAGSRRRGACGLICLIAFSLGGQPGYGLIALGVMVAFSAVIALVGRRSGRRVACLGAAGYFRVRG